MKHKIPFVLLILLSLGGCRGESALVPVEWAEGVVVAKMTIGDTELMAEVVADGQRNSGGGITKVYLPGTVGVLYPMPKKEISYFNSLGLASSADFIWIADVGADQLDPGSTVATESAHLQIFRIMDIDRGVKPESEQDESAQTLYDSGVPVNYMLEVRKDWVKDMGVRVGDEVAIQIKEGQ